MGIVITGRIYSFSETKCETRSAGRDDFLHVLRMEVAWVTSGQQSICREARLGVDGVPPVVRQRRSFSSKLDT